jgi:hypothetical protein
MAVSRKNIKIEREEESTFKNKTQKRKKNSDVRLVLVEGRII